MKFKLSILILLFGFITITPLLEARIKLVDFINESEVPFKNKFKDGTPFMEKILTKGGVLIDQPGAVIESEDGEYKIIFEDGHQTGADRPHWKFYVLVESKHGFPKLSNNSIVRMLGENKERLYSHHYWNNPPHVIKNRELFGYFSYDGDGNIILKINKNGWLEIIPVYDVHWVDVTAWGNDLTIDNSYRE